VILLKADFALIAECVSRNINSGAAIGTVFGIRKCVKKAETCYFFSLSQDGLKI
jgi:hypothetical protein